MIERSVSILFTTGKLTRVEYLRIKQLDLPKKFQDFANSMVFLTRTILYNCMIVIVSYHKFFTLTEQLHLL